VSRAYYAAYHEANRVSRYSNGSSSKSGVHEKLCEKLKTHKGVNVRDITLNEIGVILTMCKKERVNADYYIKIKYSHQNAQSIIKQVEHIISLATIFP